MRSAGATTARCRQAAKVRIGLNSTTTTRNIYSSSLRVSLRVRLGSALPRRHLRTPRAAGRELEGQFFDLRWDLEEADHCRLILSMHPRTLNHIGETRLPLRDNIRMCGSLESVLSGNLGDWQPLRICR